MGAFGGFVNAGLLAGLALASVPLIIHLLNRQRHKPMPWAAMRFVQAAWKKTRRRVELENLLLLLLRMAAVALLALAIARPFSGAKNPLAGLTESRRDLVLLVDASASMGWREGVETSFERALGRARELVHGLDTGRGDRVRLLLCATDPKLLAWKTPEEALSVLDTVTAPADEPVDLARALAEALRFAKEDAGGAGASTLEVRLLTDLQRRAFALDAEEEPARESAPKSAAERLEAKQQGDAPSGPRAAPLVEVLDELATLSVRVLVEDLGPSANPAPNLGIASVKPIAPVYGAGLPCDIAVEVQNHGPNTKNGVRVVLEVDGERRPVELVDAPGRGRAQALFQVVFGAPGEHVLTARLEGDRLPADDVRSEVLGVPPPIAVLLVDGAPGATLEEDAVGLLKSVLEPMPGDGANPDFAPFDLRVEHTDFLASPEFKNGRYDVVWIADAESVPASGVEPLERLVAAGAGLVISVGPAVNPATWNARMFARDGARLLPAELGAHVAVASRRENYYRVKEFQADHPVFAFFADERWRPLLSEVPVYELLESSPLSTARVLARFDDEHASPALVEREFDRGRVVLMTTSIAPHWTRLPESPRTLVPFAHELVRHVAAHAEPPRNVAPGAPLAAEVATFPRGLELVRPDGSRRALDGEAKQAGGGRWTLPQVEGKDTQKAGVYRIAMDGARAVSFAVQMDPREGDLERIEPRELGTLHRALALIDAGGDERGTDDGARPERGEFWRALAIACLAALVLETLWAAWLGARRTVRK